MKLDRGCWEVGETNTGTVWTTTFPGRGAPSLVSRRGPAEGGQRPGDEKSWSLMTAQATLPSRPVGDMGETRMFCSLAGACYVGSLTRTQAYVISHARLPLSKIWVPIRSE